MPGYPRKTRKRPISFGSHNYYEYQGCPVSYPSTALRPFPNSWVRPLAVLAYIDLLLFPYFQAIIIPLSLPLILAGTVVIGKATFPPKTKTPLVVLAFFMVVSMAIGFLLPHSANYAVENIKRVIQFLTSFLYLSFFFTVARQYPIENALRIISSAFLVYFTVLLAWFFFDPVSVNAMMNQVYGRLVTAEEIALMHFRFAYLFNDPNTAGYFLLIAVLPWLVLYKSMVARAVMVALCVAVAVFIQSRGVLLALILAVLLWLFPWRWLVLSFHVRDLWGIGKLSVVSTSIGIIATFFVVKYFGDIPIFDMSLDRISDAESYQSGGSRFDIWKRYATALIPLPIGSGYMFDTVHGQFFPHSDLLRLIYSYGIVAAGLFMWWLVRTGWKYPLVLMPALMAFSVNTLIDEQKLFALFLATLGVFLGIYERNAVHRANIDGKVDE